MAKNNTDVEFNHSKLLKLIILVKKYHKSIIALHWLIAIIVFILIALGLNMVDIERGTPKELFIIICINHSE